MIRKNRQDEIQSYLEDVSNFRGGKADEAVFPSNEGEVIEALKEYGGAKKFLTPSGAGTGTVAGRIPLGGGILATDSLNRIISIDKKNKLAVVEPGVRIKDLLRELSVHKLFHPAYPTEKNSFIGGNIATNASGEYSYKYGSVRGYVKKLRVALVSGEVLDIERGSSKADGKGIFKFGDYKFRIPAYTSPSIKNSAGYFSKPGMDLVDLFIGSEGTLGIVTEIGLSVISKPEGNFCLMIFFNDDKGLFAFMEEIKQKSSTHGKCLDPLSLEYFDGHSLEILRPDFPRIPTGCSGALFIEQEAAGDCSHTMEIWQIFCEKHKAVEVWYSDDSTKEKIADIRYRLPERVNEIVKKNKTEKVSLDLAVPGEYFNRMMGLYRKELGRTGLDYAMFGHIGENHLHLNLLPGTAGQKEKAGEMYMKCARKAVAFGGTISAEHGVGKLKREYLQVMYGKKGISEMLRIKKVFDPGMILAPGNLFKK